MNISLCTLRPLLFGLSIVLGGTPVFAQNALLDSIQVMGGSGLDNVVSITPDHAGNLFVLGTTQSADFPVTATFGTRPANSSNGSGDTFVAKIRLADWSLTWSAVIRPSVPLALAIDDAGAVYLTGWTDSPANFPAVTGFRSAASGPEPLFVLKLDPTGSRIVFSAYLAFYQPYTNAPIAVDRQGQVYIAAVGSGPITAGALFPEVTVGSPGAYLAKLSADGSKVVFSTFLATSATMAPQAIAVDDRQSIFVAGRDNSYNSAFPSTPGVIQPKHVGSDDAFIMKLRADGGKIEFATLLGGAGGDSANFLQLGFDGSVYVAGYCEYGSPSFADAAFPTTANAPFRKFSDFQGFVARLSPDASSLLFSTYVSDKDVSSPYTTAVAGFAISGGQILAAYPITISRGFLELNYYPTTNLQSAAVQAFDANTGAAPVSALQLPALAPSGLAISDTSLVIASIRSPISLPVPSTINPIGPLDAPTTPSNLQSDITFGKFDLAGKPDADIDTDRGDLYFEVYPGATLQQTLHITSSARSVPFRIFAPSWAASAVSPLEGQTPSAVNVTPFPYNPATSGTVPALLLVSPRAVPSIQILPVLTENVGVRVSVQADAIELPAGGGQATGTIRITADATSAVTLASTPVSLPFLLQGTVPPDLTLERLSGTTPATINVTGQLDSLRVGSAVGEQLNFTVGGQSQRVVVVLSRPGPPPLVSPTSLSLSGTFRQGSATGRVQVSAPDNATAFQVLSVPPGISVSPLAGTGSAVLNVTADLTQFLAGTTPLTFSVQVGSTPVSVTVRVLVSQYPLSVGQGPLDTAPGARLKLDASGIPVNLPRTGGWAEVSPAPTDWNGYTFVYRAHTLPILSVDPLRSQFDVQLPYDLDPTSSNAPILFLGPDGKEISRGITLGTEIPAAIALFDTGNGRAPVLKQDGSVVSSTNTVSPGDTIRLFVVGAGVTNPPIRPGLLPEPGSTVSPVAKVEVQIGGKPATVLRQALDPAFIGVTDLAVQVPKLASGLQLLGLQTGPDRVYLIQIWVAAAGAANLPAITGVSNAAGGQPGVFPGSFISIYGTNLTPVSDGWSHSIVNGQLPTQLDGVSVTIGGKPAYIAQMIPTQINAQVPDVGVGPMEVVVTTPSGSSSAYTVNSQQYGPAFWPWPGNQPVATHADYSIAAKNGTFPGTTTVPAKPGEVITLWGTGFGPVTPSVPAGQLPGQYAGAITTNPVIVSLNGTSATVLGAALSGYPGDYQVAIQIPASIPNGDYTLAATIGGVSAPTMLFTVQQ